MALHVFVIIFWGVCFIRKVDGSGLSVNVGNEWKRENETSIEEEEELLDVDSSPQKWKQKKGFQKMHNAVVIVKRLFSEDNNNYHYYSNRNKNGGIL